MTNQSTVRVVTFNFSEEDAGLLVGDFAVTINKEDVPTTTQEEVVAAAKEFITDLTEATNECGGELVFLLTPFQAVFAERAIEEYKDVVVFDFLCDDAELVEAVAKLDELVAPYVESQEG